MKLSDLAAKPQLKEIIIDDENIVKEYGDSLSFYVQDRLPIETYTKLATIKTDDAGSMYNVIKDLILDDKGMPVMADGNVLPMNVMTAAVIKVTDMLGK